MSNTRDEVVAAFRRGLRIVDIERHFGIPPSDIVWMLQEAGVTSRESGPQGPLALYLVVEAQEERIAQLEAYIATQGLELPEFPEPERLSPTGPPSETGIIEP